MHAKYAYSGTMRNSPTWPQGRRRTTRRVAGALVVVLTVAAGRTAVSLAGLAEASEPMRIAPPPGASVDLPTEWYRAAAPDGRSITLGLLRAPTPDAPTVVIFPSSNGLDRGTERFAALVAARGVNAVMGCWFESIGGLEQIACPNGPTFKYVSDDSVADLDAVATAAKQLPRIDSDRLTVGGMSRGGGAAVLRALAGRDEPAFSVNGLLGGRAGSSWVRDGADVDLVRRAEDLTTPLLLIWAADDAVVPPSANGQAFVDRAAASAVARANLATATWPTGGHGGLQNDPRAAAWTADRIVEFTSPVVSGGQ